MRQSAELHVGHEQLLQVQLLVLLMKFFIT
jgi:hypothetical protein